MAYLWFRQLLGLVVCPRWIKGVLYLGLASEVTSNAFSLNLFYNQNIIWTYFMLNTFKNHMVYIKVSKRCCDKGYKYYCRDRKAPRFGHTV